MRSLLLGLAVGVLGAVAVAAAGADEAPTLLPGGSVIVRGTHVSCSVTSTSVSCDRAGGLTATLGRTGAVRVRRGAAPTPLSRGKPRQIFVDGGFILADSQAYCHVYVTNAPTMTCSFDGCEGRSPELARLRHKRPRRRRLSLRRRLYQARHRDILPAVGAIDRQALDVPRL